MKKTSMALSEWIESGAILSGRCPSRDILRDVTSRWGTLILVVLLGGTKRYSELRRKIGGISEKMLAETLQTLEDNGFVKRRSYPVVPPHVEYSLTPLGVEIARRIEDIVNWIGSNLDDILTTRERSEKQRGRKVPAPQSQSA